MAQDDPKPEAAAAHWKPRQISKKKIKTSARGPQALSVRSAATQRMGQIITCWAAVERELVDAFSYLIQAEGWVAAEILQETRKFKAKTGIFTNYIGQKFGPGAKLAARDILNEFTDLQDTRDDIAHGFFMTSQEFPEDVILVRGWGNNETYFLYEISTLDACVAEFYKRAQAVSDLCFQIIVSSPPRYEPGRLIFPSPVPFPLDGQPTQEGPQQNPQLSQDAPVQTEKTEPPK